MFYTFIKVLGENHEVDFFTLSQTYTKGPWEARRAPTNEGTSNRGMLKRPYNVRLT